MVLYVKKNNASLASIVYTWFRKKVLVLRIFCLLFLLYVLQLGATYLKTTYTSSSKWRISSSEFQRTLQIPSSIKTSRISLTFQKNLLDNKYKKRNWTEKLIHWQTVCSVVEEQKWALLIKAHSNNCYEIVGATEHYSFDSSQGGHIGFRPDYKHFRSFKKHSVSVLTIRNNAQYHQISQYNLSPLLGICFIGRFWCHIPHFMEDLLAFLSFAFRQNDLERDERSKLLLFLPEISFMSCIMGKNEYFRHMLHIVLDLVKDWSGQSVKVLFKEDIKQIFSSKGDKSTNRNMVKHFICLNQIVYNLRDVPRPGHDVLWVYDASIILELRKKVYNAIPLFHRIIYARQFTVTLLQRQKSRRILNMQSLSSSIENFFGVRTRIIWLEDASFWKQIMIMKTTRILIAAHGAALTNIVYMKPGSAVIEISNFGCSGEPYYGSLAELSNLNYWNWHPRVASKMIRRLDQKYSYGHIISDEDCTRWRRNSDIWVSEHDVLELVRIALMKTDNVE
eukprot:jgi/Galph1/4908/GphlegSOOS_G3551.1